MLERTVRIDVPIKMSCSTVDIKAYFLGEMEARDKVQVESHLGACAECREELDRLGVMRTALQALPEEEVPRRIAFVSDKVFEPRWWQTIWRSGPAMGFASAALLAAAILVHGFTRPPVIVAAAPTVAASVDTAQIDKRIEQEVAKRVDAALAQQKQRTEQMLQASEKRYEQRRQKDLVEFQQVMRYQNQQMNHWMVASNDIAGSRGAQ
jgi:anti-sigma factor RsiW